MPAPAEQAARPRRLVAGVVGLIAAVLLASATGCGCRSETEAERAARLAQEEAEQLERNRQRLEEERRRQPILLDPLKTLPAGPDAASLFAKPGHWNAVRQPAKANAEDFDGVLTFEPFAKDAPRARVVSRRPLVVARDAAKAVDSLFYWPADAAADPKLRVTVRDRRSGARVLPDFPTPLRALLDHQYHFVVLAREPSRYAFLESLYSFSAPIGSAIDTSALSGGKARGLPPEKNYRLVAPLVGAGGGVALPDSLLTWTSIAYVLWDDIDPEALSPPQRDALVDWLNWGGQLIVSGPGSLDSAPGTFLEPPLPALGGPTRELSGDELARLEQTWSAGARGEPLDGSRPWTGVTLQPTDGATPLPGLAGLAVERRVGRGRVVVTAFSLTDPRLLAWSRGVDNFFNAALLRRPPRRFVADDALGVGPTGSRPEVRFVDRGAGVDRFDPAVNSGVRLLARDAHDDPSRLALRVVEEEEGFARLARPEEPGGVAAVRDFNAASEQVRSALSRSAGVSVPGAGFVVACLAFYLFFLVPANWALFTALGRVELAWVAAPIIALAGAWVVIQQARLDIGFVRSRTEVALLELQPDTPRGLLTRHTALYTSLSTTYELEFDNPAVAQPFPAARREQAFGPVQPVVYERQEKARLREFAVSSATTKFVRSEEMLDVGVSGVPGSTIPGSIRLATGAGGGPRLENRTAWALEDVIVVGRPDGVRGGAWLEGCWIGDLAPGQTASVVYFPIPEAIDDEGRPTLPFQKERAEAARLRGGDPADRLDLDGLAALAIDPERLEPGERRVVARLPEILPGLTIEPHSSQRRGATLVVGHLGYGLLAPPKSDVNGPLDVN